MLENGCVYLGVNSKWGSQLRAEGVKINRVSVSQVIIYSLLYPEVSLGIASYSSFINKIFLKTLPYSDMILKEDKSKEDELFSLLWCSSVLHCKPTPNCEAWYNKCLGITNLYITNAQGFSPPVDCVFSSSQIFVQRGNKKHEKIAS